jgi:hypothetical protein
MNRLFLNPAPSNSTTYELIDETANYSYSLTVLSQDNPTNTIWDAILSMYYLSANNLNDYSDDPQFKLFVLVANIIIFLILTNMIIALMK